VVGGGYIAAELAHFFGALGTEVTIIHRRDLMLREEDTDVSRRFTEVYQRRFNMVLDAQVTGVSSKDGEIIVEVTTPNGTQSITSDTLLMATGRVPNTDLLDMAKTGVELNDRGYIKTDEFLQTNVPGIWALGDIVGKYLLKHSANLEAVYASNNIMNPDNQAAVDYSAMPHAVFASPQVASVGLTEQEADARGASYITATYNYSDTAYGASIEDKDGFVKVLAEPASGEILGCHIIGTDAATLIQEAANAMRARVSTDAITQSIYVHSALPEVVQRAFGALPF
jgi:pyruvate/2-oxoglutarate dehydrogenase complex dihydrolipoamide dehydrogenase (E3) component